MLAYFKPYLKLYKPIVGFEPSTSGFESLTMETLVSTAPSNPKQVGKIYIFIKNTNGENRTHGR